MRDFRAATTENFWRRKENNGEACDIAKTLIDFCKRRGLS